MRRGGIAVSNAFKRGIRGVLVRCKRCISMGIGALVPIKPYDFFFRRRRKRVGDKLGVRG